MRWSRQRLQRGWKNLIQYTMTDMGIWLLKKKDLKKKIDTVLTHPENLIFADETGCNASMKNDGNVAGTKFITKKGTVPQQMASTKDHRFTLLPFTSATGDAVCCVVIFKSDKIEPDFEVKMGIDVRKKPSRNNIGEIDIIASSGKGNYFPGGPSCKYNGKKIDCLTFTSESGGITADILIKILKYFDVKEMFPQVPGGPIPMLLIDGHQSRLDPKFIEYINDNGHRWKICLGVPYATSLWQVGESAKNNGTFKVEFYCAKSDLLVWKYERGLTQSIDPTDIIPLLNIAFPIAFGRVDRNLSAVAERGWNPLNRILLEHPSLQNANQHMRSISTSESTIPSNTTNSFPDLNFNGTDGIASSVLNRIITARLKNKGVQQAYKKWKQEGIDIRKNIKESKKLSSGVLTKNGVFALDNAEFVAGFRDQIEMQRQEAEGRAKKKRKILLCNIAKVQSAREKHGHESEHKFQNFKFEDCGAYLQYKKNKDDKKAMPTTVHQRRARCLEVMFHPSPLASPHASDDKANNKNGGLLFVPPSTRKVGPIAHNGVALLLMEFGRHPINAQNSASLAYNSENIDKKIVTATGNHGDNGNEGDADRKFNFYGGRQR